MKRLLFLLLIAFFPLITFAQDDEQPEVPQDTSVYSMVSEMPQYKGGNVAVQNFIKENLKYPKAAKKEKIEGRVYVNFIVTNKGKIGRVWIAHGLREDMDNESIRVVSKMPDWIPGKRKGIPVNVRLTVPVYFNLK